MHDKRQAAAVAILCAAFLVAGAASAEVNPSEVIARTDAQLGPGSTGFRQFAVRGTDGPDRPLAPYFAQPGGDAPIETLPLKATRAEVEIAGVIARVTLRQTFENTGTEPIEATYVFPASTRAAVHGMRMRIGQRTIEARIDRRDQARRDYEAAKEKGVRASLLEQQRPNVFTTQVANLMPKDRIEVELEYSELLVPEENVYELIIPTVVGPRYAGGADPAKDKWIANPYLPAGTREPYAFDVRVSLRTGIALKEVQSPSHPVDVAYDGQDGAQVSIKEPGGGNRDFVLRYRLAGERIDAGVLLGSNERERFFTLVLEPPARVKQSQVVPREYVFVLDVSGSMRGFPLDTAKELMRNLLGALRESDHFNVVLFSGAFAQLSDKSIAANRANIESGIAFVDSAQGGGGTELMGALQAAYAIPSVDDGVSRSVVLVTDGYVGVEAQAFKFVRERLDSTNLFAFGIGSSVNRALIEGLARAGAGEPYVVLDPSKARALAASFQKAVQEPVLTDIRVRFHGFDAYEVAPQKLPDLMANRPLVLFGKYRGEATGEIEVTGAAAGHTFHRRISVAAAATKPTTSALQWLWARKWVELLEDQHALVQAKEIEDAITDLGLTYRLLTPFTSFVAIDNEVVNRGGRLTPVQQPLPLPQGVPNTAVGGLYNLHGSSALGSRGTGPGGGGTGLGLGGLGSIGGGRGVASMGKAEPGERKKDAGRVSTGTPKVLGAIHQDVIAKVVRRHQGEVKYCYEAALAKTPGLKGKLVVRFTIDANGKVTEATAHESSLDSDVVKACVLARTRRWIFPKPNDGGTVTVTMPWTFAPPADAARP